MRICLELFWSKRVDFLFIYLFFFCLLVIINEVGKRIGIMANFHIRGEKYLSKIFEI